MKDIFDFKRFGRFLLYDLRNAKNYFWLSLLICSALPLISFAISQTFARLFVGTWISDGLPIQIISVIMATLIVVLTFPVKAYGSITDKRSGSNWVMIPASAEEKTLSVILTSCLALPLVFVALLTGFDALTGLLFPDHWPAPLITKIWGLGTVVKENTSGVLEIGVGSILWYFWTANTLTFTLGSFIFKKAKIGKTFLVVFILGQVMSVILSVFLVGTPAFSDIFSGNIETVNDPVFAIKMLNTAEWFIGIYYWLYLIAVIALLWGRIKTIKH